MLSIIDSHCHLGDGVFDSDRHEVIQRARDCGVKALVVVSEKEEDFQKTLELSGTFPDFCFPCLGIHPVQQGPDGTAGVPTMTQVGNLESWVEGNHERLVGIGEVGLDFTPWLCKSEEDRERQRCVLRRQISLAKRYDLPLNVHSRSAAREVIELLRQEAAVRDRVVLHNFAGRPSLALQAAALGFYMSLPPAVLLHKADRQKLIRAIPLDRLVLETDSPALGPEKGVRNEPKNVTIVLDHIAAVKGLTAETVGQFAMTNSLRLFPKIKPFLDF